VGKASEDRAKLQARCVLCRSTYMGRCSKCFSDVCGAERPIQKLKYAIPHCSTLPPLTSKQPPRLSLVAALVSRVTSMAPPTLVEASNRAQFGHHYGRSMTLLQTKLMVIAVQVSMVRPISSDSSHEDVTLCLAPSANTSYTVSHRPCRCVTLPGGIEEFEDSELCLRSRCWVWSPRDPIPLIQWQFNQQMRRSTGYSTI
jgi:hypothetical protein